MNAWILLAIAILFEVAGTLTLKTTDGFTKPAPSCIVVLCYTICMVLLARTAKVLDLGIVYAIWSGTGIMIVALATSLLFKESLSPSKILFMCLIVLGVAGLHLSSPSH